MYLFENVKLIILNIFPSAQTTEIKYLVWICTYNYYITPYCQYYCINRTTVTSCGHLLYHQQSSNTSTKALSVTLTPSQRERRIIKHQPPTSSADFSPVFSFQVHIVLLLFFMTHALMHAVTGKINMKNTVIGNCSFHKVSKCVYKRNTKNSEHILYLHCLDTLTHCESKVLLCLWVQGGGGCQWKCCAPHFLCPRWPASGRSRIQSLSQLVSRLLGVWGHLRRHCKERTSPAHQASSCHH